MAGNEPVYEMFWDCGNCGTKELLGVTQRFCPNCGAPQDPKRRYFPTDDRKVAVADHVFVGADKVCPACDAPNSAKAEFCTTCGSPMDAAKGVKLVAGGNSVRDRSFVGDAPKEPPPPPSSTGRTLLWLVLGGILLIAVCCGVWRFWTGEAGLKVTGHTWERTVEIEEFRTVNDGAWRESVPSGAFGERCFEKKKDTKQVPDGEDCKTVKVDNGDGTFKEQQKCTTKYRSEDVMGTWCDFQVNRWASLRTEKATGTSRVPEPSWPVVQVTGCATLGCTREGTRNATYTLNVDQEGKDPTTCSVEEALWKQAEVGSTWVAEERMLTGIDCSTLRPSGG